MKALTSEDAPVVQPAREWRVVPMLLPYLWEYKWRVVVALVFLVTAKLANVSALPVAPVGSALVHGGELLERARA